MMRLLAKADILENQKKHKDGTEFETDDPLGLHPSPEPYATSHGVPAPSCAAHTRSSQCIAGDKSPLLQCA